MSTDVRCQWTWHRIAQITLCCPRRSTLRILVVDCTASRVRDRCLAFVTIHPQLLPQTSATSVTTYSGFYVIILYSITREICLFSVKIHNQIFTWALTELICSNLLVMPGWPILCFVYVAKFKSMLSKQVYTNAFLNNLCLFMLSQLLARPTEQYYVGNIVGHVYSTSLQ